MWLGGKPVVFILFGKVTLKGEMKKIYSRGRIATNQGASQVCDSVVEGESEVGGRRHVEGRGDSEVKEEKNV